MEATRGCVKGAGRKTLVTVTFAVIILILSAIAMGHGGKKHATGEFTALKALQEGTKLYDRLVAEGKLVESWETELAQVKISTRDQKGKTEFVVAFHRSKGEPNAVYIFFSETGKYAGSNFTGE